MRKVKIISLILVMVFTISSISSAGIFGFLRRGRDEKEQEVLRDISFPLAQRAELDMVIQSSPLAPNNPNEKAIFRRLEDETNVQINWRNYTWDQYPERKRLIIASGDLPDAFFDAAFSDDEILRYASDGTIIPLNDLIEKYMPNFKSIIDLDCLSLFCFAYVLQ